MREYVAGVFLRVGDFETHAVRRHDAGIADLPAGFAVKWRLVEHHGAALALLERGNLLVVAHQRGDDAFGILGFVAEEFGAAELLTQAEPHRFVRRFAGARPGRARLRTLTLHGVGERRDIDANTARLERVL